MEARGQRLVPFERLLDCVHCGLCLPACPSYVVLGNEADSPRGRIHLMRAAEQGEISLGPALAVHIDRCLGCLACETACPSGVRYRELIEPARAALEKGLRRPGRERWLRRLVLGLFPYRRRLEAALRPARWAQRLGLWPYVRRWVPWASLLPDRWISPALPQRLSPKAAEKGRVHLLLGCVAHVLFGELAAALARLLAASGYVVEVPRGQGCCGALALHMGEIERARHHARRLLAAFGTSDEPVVVTAAGCGSAMKDYGTLFAGTPEEAAARAFAARVRDATEFLARIELPPARRALAARVAYHDACHLLHGQRISEEPRTLLRSIPGLQLVELEEHELCCGSAGAYNLLQPEVARELARRKAARIVSSGAELVAVANPGCALQIASALREFGRPLPVRHPVELYAAAAGC